MMPRKLKAHLFNLLRVSGAYFVITTGMELAHAFMKLVTEDDQLASVEHGATAIYFAVVAWFAWRSYTGLYRDGDFWE